MRWIGTRKIGTCYYRCSLENGTTSEQEYTLVNFTLASIKVHSPPFPQTGISKIWLPLISLDTSSFSLTILLLLRTIKSFAHDSHGRSEQQTERCVSLLFVMERCIQFANRDVRWVRQPATPASALMHIPLCPAVLSTRCYNYNQSHRVLLIE